MQRRELKTAVLGALAALVPHAAAAQDPKVPPAPPVAGQTPIALLTTGFDYTRPEIAARLARDGEGELIGWDMVEEDPLPYAVAGAGTDRVRAMVELLPDASPVTLMPVRVDPADPISLAKGLAFASRTPATTVLVPMWSSSTEDWETFRHAAAHFATLRLVAPLCPDRPAERGFAVYPRDLGLPNAVTAPPDAGDPAAALMAEVLRRPCVEPDKR